MDKLQKRIDIAQAALEKARSPAWDTYLAKRKIASNKLKVANTEAKEALKADLAILREERNSAYSRDRGNSISKYSAEVRQAKLNSANSLVEDRAAYHRVEREARATYHLEVADAKAALDIAKGYC